MHASVSNIKFLFSITVLLFCIISCEKEYSYEGGNTVPPVVIIPVDTIQPVDTIPIDPGALPNCASCIASNDIAEGHWSFKTGNALLCGEVDTAFMLSLERNTFTFFGPSFCGADTGIIFTVGLGSNSLDRDITNLTASSAIFYYYHTSFPYVLLSHNDQPFSLTITSYIFATKIATGTFSGSGFRQDGRAVNVTDGKFKIKVI